MLVIIKKVNADLLFAQKIIQSTIGVQTSENIQIVYRLYRNIFGYSFIAFIVMRNKFQSIILAADTAGIEQVVGFAHVLSFEG